MLVFQSMLKDQLLCDWTAEITRLGAQIQNDIQNKYIKLYGKFRLLFHDALFLDIYAKEVNRKRIRA